VLNGKRILIVEDDASLASLIEEYLINAGAIVLGIVHTVSGALEMITAALLAGGIDAVVLDLNLQGERAWPVADLVDEHRIPFVLQTGYIDWIQGSQMPVISKPYQMESLLQVLAEICAAEPGRTKGLLCNRVSQ
jgi:DNA-binding NtrC family response regulator